LEKRLEFASFVKLISPRQSIKLEALLDERKESLGKQESAETEDENLREQLANKSTSDGQVEEMEIELDRLQESMADAENTKIQMKGEMDEIRKSGDDSSLKMQDSVIGGDSIVGSTNIETQIINEPEAIARAAIEAYRIAKNEDID
jgi:hypothetical protein